MLLLFPLTISAQKVNWESTTVNYGTVRDWNSPPAVFKFKNTGNKRLMFLPQKHGRDILVSYPNRAIEHGQTGEIKILYYTAETGNFSKTIEVFTNASNRAEKLIVKGNIKSIYADALTACPTFQSTPTVRSTKPNVVQAVDVETNLPIPNVQIEIYDRGLRKAINGTNLDGVAVNWIEPGKYIAIAAKNGYEKAEAEIVFTKRDRNQVVYLTRTSTEMEDEIEEIVFDRWEETEPEIKVERGSKTVLAPVDEIEEKFDLGINTDDQWEETSPEIKEQPVAAEVEEEKFDLGISTNEQWKEPVIDEFVSEPEIIEEEFDLGITTNELLEKEVIERKPEPAVVKAAPIETVNVEEAVEAALAESEVSISSVEPPLVLEPEPEFSSEKYRPNNVLLLLDVSGSMKDDHKMDKLKSSIRRLVLMLREVDVLTIIAYNSSSWEVLPPTPVKDNLAILSLVDSLEATGYTNGVKGLESAYESLEKQLISGGNNQLIIATDGKFNSSKFSEKDAVNMVKSNSDKGIVLSIIGFGDDREAGRLMKKLAGLGAGSFLQVKENEDPTELLAEEIKNRSRFEISD